MSDKVKCKYCDKKYSKQGIITHERACDKNPKNKEEETVVVDPKEDKEDNSDFNLVSKKTEDKIKAKEEVQIVENTKSPQERNVKIILKEYHRCNVGGEWYEFQADKQYNVPLTVKNILLQADKLKAI